MFSECIGLPERPGSLPTRAFRSHQTQYPVFRQLCFRCRSAPLFPSFYFYRSNEISIIDINNNPIVNASVTLTNENGNSVSYITDSNGNETHSPRPLKRYLKKLKRAQKRLSRKKKGSNNYIRAKTKLAKLHNKVANIRNTFLHTITKNLVRSYDNIVIEDLSVQQMMNKFGESFNRSLNDLSFYEFRRQLEYKTKLYGKNLIIADRYYPSSKLCSCCGYKKEDLILADREWICPSCNAFHNRDVNAAKNLIRLI